MNGSTGNKASSKSEQQFFTDQVLSLAMVQRMLPLVRRIVGDIQEHQGHLARIEPELGRLDRHRHDLAWPERRRRYLLQEEMTDAEKKLQDVIQELYDLGVVLLDEELPRVGFPTIVNNRAAFFSWQPGEQAPRYWQFVEELTCRPIPDAWLEEIAFAEKK